MTAAVASQRSTLPRDGSAPAQARRAIEAHAALLAPDDLDTARLLVSELVTNALQHGEGEIALTLDVDERRARVAVHDAGGARPRRRAAAGAEGGFGLNLVSTLAARWGVDADEGVWFELDRPGPPPAPASEALCATGPLEGVRSALAPEPLSRWLAIGLAFAAGLTALDVALGQAAALASLLVLPPIAVALLGRWADAAAVAGASVALALVGMLWDGGASTAELIAIVVVGVGGALAVLVALLRAAAAVSSQRFGLLSAVAHVGNEADTLQDAVARLLDMLTPAFADVSLLDAPLDSSEQRLGMRPREADRAQAETAQRRADPHTTIAIPLRARGRAIGTLTMLLLESWRSYSRSDRAFAEIFAGRAAVVLDNAGLTSELDAAERQLDAVLEGLAEAVTVMDAEGRPVYANEAALALLKLERPSDLLDAEPGQTMDRFAVYDEDGAEVALEQLPGYRVLAGERDPGPLLVRNVVKATGEERWLLNKTTSILDGAGRIVRIVNVIEDVTAAKRVELGQRLLAEASEALASSLDYERTLQRVAEVAVPRLADWCGVDLPGSDGFVQPVAVAHVDPDKVALARRLRSRYPVRLDDEQGLARVIAGGPGIVVAELSDEDLVAYARDEEHLEMLRAAGMASVMVVPLVASGTTLGALTLARSGRGRAFDESELQLAEELGRRAGTAVLNARVHTEHSAIAATLQRGLRPPELQPAPGFSLATLYRAAGELNEVGGDFYDAFTTPEGWSLVVGDVAGHGAEAAALTALARYTLRSAGQLTGDPARAVAQLNATLRDVGQLSLCTAVCAHFDRDGERASATLANCGHPPPLLLRPGEEPRELSEPGPMAGAFDEGEWNGTRVELHAGDVLLLYTDGVLDVAGEADRFGAPRLLAALGAAPARDPQQLIAHLAATLDAFQRGPQRDDVAIVALRFDGAAV